MVFLASGVSSSSRGQHCGIEHGAPPTEYTAAGANAIRTPSPRHRIRRRTVFLLCAPARRHRSPLQPTRCRHRYHFHRSRESWPSRAYVSLSHRCAQLTRERHPTGPFALDSHFSRPPFRVNRILRRVAPPFPSTAAFRFADLGTPEPRGRHHGQAQHGHERHRVRMGIRQGEGWPDDLAKDHHGHIQPELAWVSRPVRQELGWI